MTLEGYGLHRLVLKSCDEYLGEVLVASPADAKGRGILFSLEREGSVVTLSGANVYLVWRHRVSGKRGCEPFSATDATSKVWEVYYPAAMIEVGGMVDAQVMITLGSERTISTRVFGIRVEPVLVGGTESEDGFTLFAEALAAYEAGTAKIDEVLEELSDTSALKGPKGDKGDTGATGPQGPAGPKGDTGDTGPAGPVGPAGADGAAFTYADFTEAQLVALKGPKGDKGEKGDTGDMGPMGPAGADGIDGAPGTPGPKGETGETGPQGPAGPAGADGTDGAPGAAFTFADFTEEQLAALKGPKGDKGDPGQDGAGVSVTAVAPLALSETGALSIDLSEYAKAGVGAAGVLSAWSLAMAQAGCYTECLNTAGGPYTGVREGDLLFSEQSWNLSKVTSITQGGEDGEFTLGITGVANFSEAVQFMVTDTWDVGAGSSINVSAMVSRVLPKDTIVFNYLTGNLMRLKSEVVPRNAQIPSTLKLEGLCNLYPTT